MKTMINIKADKDVKKKAQKIAADLGMPLSTVINAYLKEFIRTKEVRFSLRDTLPLGKSEGESKAAKKRLYAQMHKETQGGKNIVGHFDSVKEMDDYLDSIK